jgi:hypothetical protein
MVKGVVIGRPPQKGPTNLKVEPHDLQFDYLYVSLSKVSFSSLVGSSKNLCIWLNLSKCAVAQYEDWPNMWTER